MTLSEDIFTWLEENKDFIKADGICKKLEIDKSNFSRYRLKKVIPEKYIEPIYEIISEYGFKKQSHNHSTIKEVKELQNELIGKTNDSEIKKQIDAIALEKIPAERSTILGKKIWEIEQKKKIEQLRNQLK